MNSALPFKYSLLRNATDTSPKLAESTWEEFVESLKEPRIGENKDGEAWIPATFGNIKNDNGSLRHDRNVEVITALVLDFDNKKGEGINRQVIEHTLAEYTYVAHTSFSHLPPEIEKWRVILPLEKPLPPSQLNHLFGRCNRMFNGAADPSGKNPSSLFYLPACPSERRGFFQSFRNDGVLLSLKNLCPPDIRALIESGTPKGGDRSDDVWRVVRALVAAGYKDNEILDVLMNPAHGISERPRQKGKAHTLAEIERIREKVGDDGTRTKTRGDGAKKAQATLLVELAEAFEVFHDKDGKGYTVVETNDHRETWPIRSKDFRSLLAGEFYRQNGKACNGNSIADAVNTIEARAVYQGDERRVYLRVARMDDRIIIDLGDNAWRCIEVSADGWKIHPRHSVHFVRKQGMAALPIPMGGGSADKLAEFLNIGKTHFELVVGWILGALRGKGPFPVLVLQGEQGTGKSTTCRVLRNFVDPSTVPLRSPPREVRDLLVSAVNNYLVVLDNLSGLNPEMSDCLCRFSTGGGLDARQLYTDMEQVLVDIQRPVLVNGIDDIATRPDLGERSIILNLPFIDPTKRRDERSFWAEFDEAAPKILGAILDALSCALRRESSVTLERMPRMADFALWVTAAEPALGWPEGTFLEAYQGNQDDALEAGIEGSPVGATLLELVEDNGGNWLGSPSQLLNALTIKAGNRARSPAWPFSPKGMKNIINRLAPSLRRLGVTVGDGKDGDGKRFYKITKGMDSQSTADRGVGTADSKTHVPYLKASNRAGLDTYGGYGACPGTPTSLSPSPPSFSSSHPLKNSWTDKKQVCARDIESSVQAPYPPYPPKAANDAGSVRRLAKITADRGVGTAVRQFNIFGVPDYLKEEGTCDYKQFTGGIKTPTNWRKSK